MIEEVEGWMVESSLEVFKNTEARIIFTYRYVGSNIV